MKTRVKNSHQANRKLLFLIILTTGLLNFNGYSQQIDYSKKSNILNPDTLKGDQKLIFWHFVKLTHEEAKSMTPQEIKTGFEKLGITTDQRARFVAAYSFFLNYIRGHKKSCEQWQHFKDLEPEND